MILNTKREERDSEADEEETTDVEDASDSPAYLTDACSNCGSFTLYLDEADGEIACDTCGFVGKVEATDQP